MAVIPLVSSPAAHRAGKGIHHACIAMWIPFPRLWRAGDDTVGAL